jgi:hypothetical protein
MLVNQQTVMKIAAPADHIKQEFPKFSKETEIIQLEKGANASDGGGGKMMKTISKMLMPPVQIYPGNNR